MSSKNFLRQCQTLNGLEHIVDWSNIPYRPPLREILLWASKCTRTRTVRNSWIYPITFPRPVTSVAWGASFRINGSRTSLWTSGYTEKHMMAGKKICNCLRYSKGSSSVYKKPKGLPKATVEITSKVKKVVIRARFIGLYTVSVETYFRQMRPNIRMRCSSMSFSR